MNAPSEFVEGLVKSVDKENLSNLEKFLAATGIMACWTVLAITGHTPMEPLITMYQMILGGLGVGGAMAWKAK